MAPAMWAFLLPDDFQQVLPVSAVFTLPLTCLLPYLAFTTGCVRHAGPSG